MNFEKTREFFLEKVGTRIEYQDCDKLANICETVRLSEVLINSLDPKKLPSDALSAYLKMKDRDTYYDRDQNESIFNAKTLPANGA